MSADPRALEALATVLGWLLTYLVHSTLLLGGAWLVTCWPLRASRAREVVWKLALVGGLATTAVQGVGARAPLAGEWRWAAPVKVEVHSELHRVAAIGGVHATPGVPRMRVTRTLLGAWRAWLAVAWLGGALAGIALLVAGHRRAMTPLARRDSLAGTRWDRALRRVAARMGVTHAVRLTTTAALATPVAIGAGEVCLPRRVLAEFEDGEIEAILAHELAHLTRRDPFWLTAARVIARLAFFQPLNVLAWRRLQELAELRADDLAARATGGGRALAGSLVRVAAWVGEDATPLRLVAMAEPGGSALVRRVERLLAPGSRQAHEGRPAGALVAGVVATALVAVGAPRVEAGWRAFGSMAPGRVTFVAGVGARETGTVAGPTGRLIRVRTTAAPGERPARAARMHLERILLLAEPAR